MSIRNYDGYRRMRNALSLLILLLSSASLTAQSLPQGESSAPKKSTEEAVPVGLEQIRPDEPVDLALEFMLRGKDLAVAGPPTADTGTSVFIKRGIAEPKPLTPVELNAINPQSKEEEISIPLRGYPAPDQAPLPNKPLYAEAKLGLHMTAGLRAGLSGNSWPFDYHAAAEFESSQGFVEHGEGSHFSAALGGGYVVGLGYGIFSGGYMGADAHFTTENYRLYAVPEAPERSHLDWGVSATGTAAYAGIDFEGTGRLRHAGIDEKAVTAGTTANAELAETSVEGALTMKARAIGLGWQGKVDLRLTNATPGSINYGAFDLSALFETSFFSLRAGGGVSVGSGTVGESVVRLAPKGELRIFPTEGFTLSGKVGGGVRQTTVQSLATTNLYLGLGSPILPEDERLSYELTLHLEPAQAWGMRVGGARREYDSYLYFDAPASGRFAPLYDKASVNIINGDFYWKLDSRNELLAVARYTQGELATSSGELPYMPRWDAEMSYTRRLLNAPVSLTGIVRYIGERRGGTATLDPAILLGFEGGYSVTRYLDLLLEGRNLLNTDYQLWDGYQEQGIYVGLGARARF